MFGSQALETAIGLAVMFFLLATAASAITEVYAAILNVRSKDLKAAIQTMLNSGTLPAGVSEATPADVEKLLLIATGKASAAYLSAKSFADAASELIAKGENIGILRGRMETLAREGRGQLTSVKAGLETWFDETMSVARQEYSRFATIFLFVTGVVLAIGLNASAVNVAGDLWTDAAARQAVVAAAGSTEATTATCQKDGTALEQAQCAVGNISAFQLPIGWGPDERADMTAEWWLSHVAGWLLTGLLIMLGAPFWFDLLNRLVNLRANGSPPEPAAKDPGSNVTLTRVAGTNISPLVLTPADGGGGGGGGGVAEAVFAPASITAGTPLLRPVTLSDAGAQNWLEIALNKTITANQ